MSRRRLCATIPLGVAALSGCLGDTEEDGPRLEYAFSEQIPWGDLPEERASDLFGDAFSPGPDSRDWIWGVVTFRLERGTIDAADLFLTSVEQVTPRDPIWHDPRVLRITQPDEEILHSINDTFEIEAEAEGEIYFLFVAEVEDPVLLTHRLESDYEGLVVEEI